VNGGRSISVIIPTHDRPEQLLTCLRGLAEQTASRVSFEVLVIMDGCTDRTHAIVSAVRLPYALTILRQPRNGQAVARNLGAAEADGRTLLFLDDDIIPEPDLVDQHARLHERAERAVGLGAMPQVVPPLANWYVRWYAQRWNAHYAHLASGRPATWQDCYGGNLSLVRTEFLDIGGFATDLPHSHDAELGYRLQEAGMTFVYLSRAVGRHDDRKGTRELTAAIQRHGVAAVELSRRHPAARQDLLDHNWAAGPRSLRLRRVLLRLDVAPHRLAAIGALLPIGRLRHKWARLVHDYGYWRGVAYGLGGQRNWLQTQTFPRMRQKARGQTGARQPGE
jgi:glycosyltransferase involved in cell wall biosynthesis